MSLDSKKPQFCNCVFTLSLKKLLNSINTKKDPEIGCLSMFGHKNNEQLQAVQAWTQPVGLTIHPWTPSYIFTVQIHIVLC